MSTGLLLANLGTPDAPTAPALRRYLREFLWDRRVVDLPRWKWWLILNLFVLTTRPKRSAAAYRRIWTDGGSPLLVTARRQAAALRDRLKVPVALGMRYGNPSLADALAELRTCERVVLFPLYPQYSRTTTESTFDALQAALGRRDPAPRVRRIRSYHDNDGYIRALASSVRERWEAEGEAERLLISFHGIPERYRANGDPYPAECERTASLLAQELGLGSDRWLMSFQSRFGREPWVKPYTDEMLRAWAGQGVASVDVICPGFSADCLETIDEIDRENRLLFTEAGGGRFRYIPALNERGDHIDCLAAIAVRYLT